MLWALVLGLGPAPRMFIDVDGSMAAARETLVRLSIVRTAPLRRLRDPAGTDRYPVEALSAGGFTSSPRSGSPQRANMLALTSSRSAKTDAKLLPDGWMGSAMSTVTAPRRGNH